MVSRQLKDDSIPSPGKVDFGDLRRLTPISYDCGFDRGFPIDRYYIEKFLSENSEFIKGRVLEIGDNYYTKKFGGDRVTKSDILHVDEKDDKATIIGDLEKDRISKPDTFDCIILTQTLQYIYNLNFAIDNLYKILKLDGAVLTTVPGISQTYDKEWRERWYWNFTPISVRRLFTEVFGDDRVEVCSYGNVFTVLSFLHGLANEELSKNDLDYHEQGYELTISVLATKK